MPDWSAFLSLLKNILVAYCLIGPFLHFLFIASRIAALLVLFACHLCLRLWLAVVTFEVKMGAERRIGR